MAGKKKMTARKTKDIVGDNLNDENDAAELGDNEVPDSESGTTCDRCLQNTDSGMSIRCDICQAVYDQECSGMQSDTFDTLLTIITESGWVCLNCKSSHLRTVDKLILII